MILERLFPKNTSRYAQARDAMAFLKPILQWNPERWISGWLMVLSGANVVFAADDRYFYLDMSTFSIPLLIFLIGGGIGTAMLSKFPKFPQSIVSARGILFYALTGSILFISGFATFEFNIKYLFSGGAYLAYFLAAWLVYSIEIKLESDKKTVPPKIDQVGILISVLILLSFSCFAGFSQNDPMISTVSAIFIPFILVALIFPAHVRHIQRARMYGVFVPAMFLSIRFPWFLIPLAVVFYGLRKITYFQTDEVYPSFRVDFDELESD